MIRVEDRDGVRILCLDRPDKANALTREMLLALEEAAAEAEGARALILTGAGKVFSAGLDLAEAGGGLPTDPIWDRLSNRIAGFAGPTVAALNGTCAGGAIGMVLACDFRLAPPGAKLFYPVIAAGFLPQPADPPRLVALAGHARARRMLLLGERVTSEEALEVGLIDRLCPPDSPVEAALDLLAPALKAKPDHVAGIKARLV